MRSFPRILTSLAAVAAALVSGLSVTACGGGGTGSLSSGSLVTISTAAVPPGATGQAYAAQLEAVFPHPPGLFIVSAGRLPPGLSLDHLTGAITGFPRQLGRFNFDISARDGLDTSIPSPGDRTFSEAVRSYTLDVSRGAPNLLPQAVPAAQYRRAYQYQLDIAGGTPPYEFSLTHGTLPAGITLGADGRLGSFPTQANAAQGVPFEFDAQVKDAAGLVDTGHFALSVTVLPLIILTSALPEAAQHFPCNVRLELASTGGGEPITWSQVPPTGSEIDLASIGMEVSPDGHVCNSAAYAGPTAVGTHTFSVQVTDEAGQVMTRQYTLTVNPGPVLTGITPSRASQPGPFVVTGANFQPGISLTFKPGPNEVTITPTFVSPTELRFSNAPSAPGGAGGATPVMAKNPDAGSDTLKDGFVFPATTVAFGTKGFLASDVSSTGLDCADVDGDGFADVVHCGSAGMSAYAGSATSTSAGLVYHHNLSTSPPTFDTLVLDASSFYDVKLADVNLDGNLDVVALERGSVRVFLNGVGGDPRGTFSTGPVSALPSGIAWPSEMTIGRFDGDLLPDLAFGVPNYPNDNVSGACHLMLGDGSGAFQTVASAVDTITNSYGVISLCSADSDGDGRDEICAGVGKNPYSGPMWNHNGPAIDGSFSAWAGRGGPISNPAYGSTTGMVAADFDGSGVKSVLAVMTGAPAYSDVRTMRLFSGAGFSSETAIQAPQEVTKCLTALDADFDTKMDFAVSTSPASVQIYRGSTLTSVITLDLTVGTPTVSAPRAGRLATGDLDGDGRPDLLVTTSYWASEGMAASHGSYYALDAVGDGGSKGVVFFLNTSN